MTQTEVIEAILAGEALDVKHPKGDWSVFSTVNTHIETALDVYLCGYKNRYTRAKFRIKPNTVRYQTRAFLYEGDVHMWTSSSPLSALEYETMLVSLGGHLRWLEETQEKEYTL